MLNTDLVSKALHDPEMIKKTFFMFHWTKIFVFSHFENKNTSGSYNLHDKVSLRQIYL